MQNSSSAPKPQPGEETLAELLDPVFKRWRLMLILPVGVGALSIALSFLFSPIFTATAVVLPPQQGQGSALLSMLGDLGGLAGGTTGTRSSIDQYVSLLSTANVRDRIIAKFDLKKVYNKQFREELYDKLDSMVTITAGKKDGLMTIAVDDEDPKRAAEMANAYIEELRRISSTLALTDAQQRRLFYEGQLSEARKKLEEAQSELGKSGFVEGALNAEPQAAADRYAQLSAQVAAQEVLLRSLRSTLTDNAVEVQRAQAMLGALKAQQATLERTQSSTGGKGPEYLNRYREFKYRQQLFEMLAKQYEMARIDEAQDAGLIQVIDTASPPDKKSRPKRALIGLVCMLLAALGTGTWLALRGQRERLHATQSFHA